MVKQEQALLRTAPVSVHTLYDAYAGMLLGYIFEIVQDRKVAEDHLVRIFGSVAKKFGEIDWTGTNNWCLLQRFAKAEMAAFDEASKGCAMPAATPAGAGLPNKYLDLMTGEQKNVFCNIYYSRKTTAQLARETNQPEDQIKRWLKEAFAIIRRSNEN